MAKPLSLILESHSINEDLDNIHKLKYIVKTKRPQRIRFRSGETMNIDAFVASVLVFGYESLSDINKSKFEKALNLSPKKVIELVQLSLRQMK